MEFAAFFLGGGNGFQQEDADALCKIKLDNPDSVAVSFVVAPVRAAPGICCTPEARDFPDLYNCSSLGIWPGCRE